MARASVNELLAIHNELLEESGRDDLFSITAGDAHKIYTMWKEQTAVGDYCTSETARIYAAIFLGLQIGMARGYLAAVSGK